jgi:hypothetical protein
VEIRARRFEDDVWSRIGRNGTSDAATFANSAKLRPVVAVITVEGFERLKTLDTPTNALIRRS